MAAILKLVQGTPEGLEHRRRAGEIGQAVEENLHLAAHGIPVHGRCEQDSRMSIHGLSYPAEVISIDAATVLHLIERVVAPLGRRVDRRGVDGRVAGGGEEQQHLAGALGLLGEVAVRVGGAVGLALGLRRDRPPARSRPDRRSRAGPSWPRSAPRAKAARPPWPPPAPWRRG